MADHLAYGVKMDAQGRLVVPAAARRALGAEPGETLVLSAERGRLTLETREAVVARLRRRWARRVPSADQLIAARRDDAAREHAREAQRMVRR